MKLGVFVPKLLDFRAFPGHHGFRCVHGLLDTDSLRARSAYLAAGSLESTLGGINAEPPSRGLRLLKHSRLPCPGYTSSAAI